MQSSAWIALLRHIPLEQQSRFMLVTASGTEITVHSFLLIELEFVVVKGRLSGTQDIGRVFFIPYANLDYFGFQQPVKDEEFTQLFGNLEIPAAFLPPVSPSAAETVALAVEPPVPAPPGATPRPTIRSEVLERFRSRPPSPSSSAHLPRPTQT